MFLVCCECRTETVISLVYMLLFGLEIKISLAEFYFTFNIKWNHDFEAFHV